MGLQSPTTANLAMEPIRAQNALQLLKLDYENNDLEAKGRQRLATVNLLEVAENGNTVSGDGVTNSRNDSIEGCRSSFVHDINAVVINEQ